LDTSIVQSSISSAATDAARTEASGTHASQAQKMSANVQPAPQSFCRIALLTPYDGGNLGDAVIQDSLIANLRLRLPDAQFSAISLSGESFVHQHGVAATFPLCATHRPFYGMARESLAERIKQSDGGTEHPAGNEDRTQASSLKGSLKAIPILGPALRAVRNFAVTTVREFRHSIGGYRFLRMQDLLIVSGGGQFDEEWGGPWGHPFALFKWALLARMASVPLAIPSVGTGRATSKTSRWLMSAALRMAQYRSYRDENSKAVASNLLKRAAQDSVIADLAFSIPTTELRSTGVIRSISQGRKIIAISPIAYAKPGKWPRQDQAVYDRYIEEMVRLVSQLVAAGYFLVIVSSSLGDDDRVIPEILNLLDEDAKKKLPEQTYVPAIGNWKDLAAVLSESDVLIASRLHSVVLGLDTDTPSIAISFNPKVNWVMEDFGQTKYLLDIHQFTAENIMEAIGRIDQDRRQVIEQIQQRRRTLLPASELQYDALAALASSKRGTHQLQPPSGAVTHAG
jgi:polysaccharide pyruvyl transferase WcaK-like protein